MSGSRERLASFRMKRTNNALAVWGMALVGLLLLGGCATHQAKPPPMETHGEPAVVEVDVPRWHYLRFLFARNDDNEVDRYLDLLVANEIIAPVLEANRQDLTLWRFHRRWPKDRTGHQFSFIVLTDAQTVARMDAQIASAALLRGLREDGYLREYRVDVSKAEEPGALSATSDRSWPELLQREWPHFIMGASRMWLGLVQAESREALGHDVHTRYEATSEAIDALWFKKGNHALFHHLSALFGYQPVRVIRRDIMTF